MPLPKRRRNKSFGLLAFTFIVALIMLVSVIGWLISLDWRIFQPSVIAEIGTVETAYFGTGLALREEVVLNSPIGGEVDQYVSEGIRVPAQKVLAVVTDKDFTSALTQEQSALQRRLDDILTRNPLNKTSATDGEHTSSELSVEENAIRQRLTEIEQGLQTCRAEIVSSTAGEVAFFVDGLESPGPKIAISNLLNLQQPLSDFPKVPQKPVPTMRNRMVEADKPVVKIVDTLQFWVVTDLPAEAMVKVGQRVKVRFNGVDQQLWAARVDKMVPNRDFLRVVLFFPDYQPFFTKQRWSELNVVTEYHEGIRVPLRALNQTANQEYQVFVKGLGGVVSKPVRIIAQDAEHAIVDGLAEGTRIVL